MQELTITRLGHLGDGIAHSGKGDVYVPFTLPGEIVAGEVTGGRMAEARIVQASPARVVPPCPVFGQCGGCALQHASDEFLANWKIEALTRALAAQGLEVPLRPIITAPRASRRRAQFTARRTKKTVQIGFHARGSDVLVDTTQCQILQPDLLALRPVLEAVTRIAASRKGSLRLSVTLSEGGADLEIAPQADGGKTLDAPLTAALAQLVEAHGLARLSWNGEVLALRVPPIQRFGRAAVVPPPGAFLQASFEGEAALVAAVSDAVGPATRIVDLFAGCGTFALPLASAAEVHAVEGDAAMTAALDAGWRAAEGLKRVTTETRDLFRRPLLRSELSSYDAAVIDPPFAGAEAQSDELAAAGVPVIAMASCNPATFARDARILVAAGYRIDWVQPIDQFRWSGHLELVARLSK